MEKEREKKMKEGGTVDGRMRAKVKESNLDKVNVIKLSQ